MALIVYAHNITPRLEYIVGFIAKELKLEAARLVSNPGEFKNYQGVKINYSDQQIAGTEIRITPHSLLFEKNIKDQNPGCFDANGKIAFFKSDGDFPFDIFAASFYLISRYEEYLPHVKDTYGRYAHENSLAYKEKFLELPLVNTWIRNFRSIVDKKFPSTSNPDAGPPRFTFLPTYDIDIAWSYKHKGWWRNIGGGLRSMIKGDWAMLKERTQVLWGKQQDPFDAFAWMDHLHDQYQLKPRYFFLVPEQRGRYDKNISPSHPEMKKLVRDHVNRYPIGIHPSWKSGDNVSLLKREIQLLSGITGGPIVSSRQHYIRFNLPGGYQRLIDNGIKFDYSMGYGSINGFRASVCSPFYWYDLENERQTDLLLFPFCYMEANSFYEQKYSADQALEEMRKYYRAVKAVDGHLIMIWHNSFLGTEKAVTGWRDVYAQFIMEVSAGN